jgi:MFS transporter, DHA2 family, multidrug resistance protein
MPGPHAVRLGFVSQLSNFACRLRDLAILMECTQKKLDNLEFPCNLNSFRVHNVRFQHRVLSQAKAGVLKKKRPQFGFQVITTLSIAAVVCLGGFALWELRRADPIVDLALLKHRNFAVGNLLLFVLGFTLMGSTVLVPLFVQSLLGYTATDAGLVLSPGGFAIMLLMPITGALAAKVDSRIFIAIGLVAGALALFHMTGFDATTDYDTIVIARIYQSISLAFLFIPINTTATVGLPMHKSDKIFANMTRNIGGSFGISVVTTILARRQQYHQSVLVEHVSPLNHAYHATIQGIQQSLAAHAASASQILGLAQARLAGMMAKQALALSFIDVFWFMGIAFLAATPLIFLLRPGKPRGGGIPVH